MTYKPMSNATGFSILFLIWFSGVGSCLSYQGIRHLYNEAKACEAVQCEGIRDYKDKFQKAMPPVNEKDNSK